MARRKLTKEFPAGVKPLHVGVYKTKLLGRTGHVIEDGWSFWDGSLWSNQRLSIKEAHRADMSGGCQNKP